LTPGEPPPYEPVAAQAKADWLAEQRSDAKRATLDAFRAPYEIVVTAPTATDDRVTTLSGKR
jgi:hypothetical protein